MKNKFKLGGFSVLLGAVAGAIIWVFLKVMSVGMEWIWQELPGKIDIPFYTLIVCTIGGLLIGLLHKKFGDYPEELSDVIRKVKTDKSYEYKKMATMLVAALLPLLFGSSVGPEAGLTGIIVGLCYWVGDNLKAAHEDVKEYTRMGMAVTLSVMFHSPLFGIFAVEEDEENGMAQLSKKSKILIYGLALAGGAIIYKLLSQLFGAGLSGFPSFKAAELDCSDYPMMIIYIVCGCVLALVYNLTHKYAHLLAHKMPVVIRETVGGICLGLMGTFLPILMFSGEEEMAELMVEYVKYLPAFLIAVSFLKILLTNICIQTGLRGGHFFPVIFAGVCMGYGMAMLIFPGNGHEVFAAAIVTATLLGATMKKPLAVTMLLFICFPIKYFIWIFVAAAIGGRIFAKKESAD